MRKLLFVFFTILFIFPVSGQSYDYLIYINKTAELSNYSPSYSVIAIPNDFSVNPGDTVDANLFVTGFGNIKENKIRLFLPPNLLYPENPGVIGFNIACFYSNNNTTIPLFSNNEISLVDSSIGLGPCLFMSPDNIVYPNENCAPLLYSEMIYNYKPPHYLKMNIDEKAPPGDYNIDLVFTYTDGIKWYQDRQKIKIHVNNLFEENIKILFIFTTILGLIITCISIEDKIKRIAESFYGKFFILFVLILALIIFISIYTSI